MSWWQALILGVLQGLTEFLPVSSSGHLAVAQILFDRFGSGFHQPGVVFDAMLHVGTAAAVVWSERGEIKRWLTTSSGVRMLGLLVVGTLATAVFAFPLRHVAEKSFGVPAAVGAALIVTGVIVAATRFLDGGDRDESATSWIQAGAVGLIQGLAVFPGISRSGSTIAAGLGAGLNRRWAARFSFLLSVPAIAGVTLVELVSQRHMLAAGGVDFWAVTGIGTAAAAVTGFVALRLVIFMVSSRVFHRFAWYCIPLGILVLLLM